MSDIKELTPEIEAKIPGYIARAMAGVKDGGRYRAYNTETAKECVFYNYEFAEYQRPVVMTVENPKEAQLLFMYIQSKTELETMVDNLAKRALAGEDVQSEVDSLQDIIMEAMIDDIRNGRKDFIKEDKVPSYLFTMNIYSNVYFTWYKFIQTEFNVDCELKDELHKFGDLYFESNIYDVLTGDTLAIVVKYPKRIHTNDTHELHNTDGVAVEWGCRYPELDWKTYFINGRNIPADKMELALSGDLTRDEWMNEPNEDIRAAWYEVLGQEKMLELLGAVEIDRGQFTHANGDVEDVVLYKTSFTLPALDDQPLAWVRFTCPSTGTNYLIDVEPKWDTALEAAISTSPFFGDEITKIEDYKFNKRS